MKDKLIYTNIVAYYQQNRYVRLPIYIDLFILRWNKKPFFSLLKGFHRSKNNIFIEKQKLDLKPQTASFSSSQHIISETQIVSWIKNRGRFV